MPSPSTRTGARAAAQPPRADRLEGTVGRLLRLPAPRRRSWLRRAGASPDLVAALVRRADRALGASGDETARLAGILRDAGRDGASSAALAAADHVLAKSRHRAGRYREACVLYARAARRYAGLGLHVERDRVRLHRVDALYHVGRPREADAEARRLRRAFLARGDDLGAAKLLVHLANVRHAQDRHPEAIRLLERARPVLAAAGHALAVAHIDMNLANSWSQLAGFARSRALYERARRAYAALGQPVWAAQVEYNEAYDRFLQGRLAESRRLLARAREAFRREGARHHLALAALDEAEMALSVNRPEAAADAAAEARRAFLATGEAIQAARATLFAGSAARLLGEGSIARARFAAARARFARLGQLPGVAACDLARAAQPGLPAERRRQLAFGAARTFARHALHGKEATALVVAGAAALDAGRREAGRRLLERALGLARRQRLKEPELRAEHALGRAAQDRGRTASALAHYRRALAAYEKLRAGIRSDEDRLGFAVDKSVVFEAAMQAALDLGRIDVAFEVVERARSRALADLLAGDDRFSGSLLRRRPALARRLARLKRELVTLEARARAQERRAEALPALLATRLRRALAAGEEAMDAVARREPEASYALAGWPVIATDALRAALGERVLLAYFAEGDEIGALALAADGLRCERRLATRASVERDLLALRFSLAQARDGAGATAARMVAEAGAAGEILSALRLRLLGPLEGFLRDRHLVVVPNSFLHLVPFHALMRAGRPLVEEREVTVAPSGTVLVQALRRVPRTSGALVVSAADADAPSIAAEAAAVAALLGACRLDGARATARALRREAPRARVVHVAAHGVYEPDEPLLSGLRLADGRLTLPEVAALGLDADLVVLSACDSGVGTPRGDEVLGLARSFLHAGTRALVASLWSVADASTAALMQSFYRRLRSGDGSGSALRAAVLELRRERPHPYHWAPFVNVGAWDAHG